MYLHTYNESDDTPICVDDDRDPYYGGDGIYTCMDCAAPLDEGGECSNPNCRLHPTNGGYAGTYPD